MPLLERRQQTEALHDAVARARAGDGNIVLVCGEAGVTCDLRIGYPEGARGRVIRPQPVPFPPS